MPPAPLPKNEAERLKNLYYYQLLDTVNEDVFDSITTFASNYFNVPIALISLVDKDRQWFKSCIGLDVNSTNRDVAFCAYAILNDEPLIVPDARLDERFKYNPLVTGEPFIRFYAGMPLHTQEGFNIGTLCLIDTKPRELSEAQLEKLKYLTNLVVTRVQLRLATLTLKNMRTEYNHSKADPTLRSI